MSRLLVCIPTIKGREKYLERAVWGYATRTPEVAGVEFCIIRDRETCGEGWQEAIDNALESGATPDYIHFGNDDIVVGEGWFQPLAEAVERGFLPAPRLEPAGVHLGEEVAESMAPAYAEPSHLSYWYADLPEHQPKEDFAQVDHGALPFCSLGQWRKLGPFIPIHFGTDKWFYERARQERIPVVARMTSVIFNYAAQIGRAKGDWTETDLIDFDLNIAYPLYVHGRLQPTEKHPLRLTPRGLELARKWRKDNLPPPYHWES